MEEKQEEEAETFTREVRGHTVNSIICVLGRVPIVKASGPEQFRR